MKKASFKNQEYLEDNGRKNQTRVFMLKFFRRIRQKLLDEGSLRKYLIYAIGEILLVMVGILLALQVNNWNEERKDFSRSREILLEIKENLEFNTLRFREEIKEEQAVIHSIDIVLKNITEIKVYDDSLTFHLFNVAYWPGSLKKTSGYETLKSQGVELIKSTKLRKAIIEIYEGTYPKIAEIVRISEDNAASTLVPIFSELFYTQSSVPNQPFHMLGATPLDYNEVLQSRPYRGFLSFWRLSRVVSIETRMEAIEKNDALIDLINKELGID